MNSHSRSTYVALPSNDPAPSSGDIPSMDSSCSVGRPRQWSTVRLIAIIELFHLLVLGIVWLTWSSSGSQQSQATPDPLTASYLSLQHYREQVLFDEGSFDGRNHNESLWKSLLPAGQGIVSLPRSSRLVAAQQWSRSSPLDDSQALYQVSLFHNLHCLDMIRHTLLQDTESPHKHGHRRMADAAVGDDDGDVMGHTMHCVDWIRQALVCNADLALDATDNYVSFGDGSRHLCRSFDAVFAWTEEHSYRGSLAALGSIA